MNIQNANKGFTLIELMLVVVVIGVLTAVAVPSYTNYITRANRTEAMEKLNEVMSQQQRYVLRQRSYTTDLTALGYSDPITTANGLYTIAAAECDPNIVRCVALTATASGRQAGDGDFTLNSRGDKKFNGIDGWNHR